MKDFTLRDFIYLIVIFTLIFLLSKFSTKEVEVPNPKPIDTTYNKVIIDSIEYNIIKRDSIIINIKDSIRYELQYNQTANDTVVVINFQKLLSD